jgi:radical SAM protein with 4Fe4S-binding SPASM domain
MHCGFCLQQMSDRKPILPFELAHKILTEEMVARDVRLITLTGGEPTFGPYRELSLKIIRLATSLGMETSIFTNGVLLDDATLDEFKVAGLSRFRVSLYDPIDWTDVRKLIAGLRRRDWPTMFKYTVTKENYPLLDSVLKMLPEADIDWFQIKPYNRLEIEQIDQQYELEPKQVLAMAKTLLGFRRNFPAIKVDLLPLCYEFLVDDSLTTDNLSLCHCGKGSRGYMVIDPEGEVRICGAYPDPIGNANTDTIADLWINHPLLAQVRNLANRPRPIECQDCSHWEKCAATDCHSATFAKFGNFNHGNPQCPLIAGRQ